MIAALALLFVACGVRPQSSEKETGSVVAPVPEAPALFLSDRSADPQFAAHWRDGLAEMNGYRVVVNRYGEDRVGEGVMIFVTEPFSLARRVKLDEPSLEPADAVEVLKLNMVIDFQTGIYDYNTMTSVFSHTDNFSPLKISFSSAEWCGHVYDELIFQRDRVAEKYFSYFEGESFEGDMEYPVGGVTEENLFILLRDLGGEFLAPGESRTVPFLPSSFHRRLAHKSSGWTSAEITRASAPEEITVPAGKFTVTRYIIRVEDGRSGAILIESDYPHRIVRWRWIPGNAYFYGELTGSARLPYWSQHAEGDEKLRGRIGL